MYHFRRRRLDPEHAHGISRETGQGFGRCPPSAEQGANRTPHLRPGGSKIIRLRREEILFLEGYGDYVKVHRINGKPLLTQVSLKRFEEFLDRNRFCRVHRSYIVSLSHINYIERKRIRIGEELIPISDSYLPALMNNLALQE